MFPNEGIFYFLLEGCAAFVVFLCRRGAVKFAVRTDVRDVYYFNPENDLAIAQGGANYCAPPLARAIARDLSLLPLWYGHDGGIVLTSLPVDKDWMIAQREALEITSGWADVGCFRIEPGDRLYPWGWSPAVVKRLVCLGAGTAQVPTTERLEHLRHLSHRATAIAVLTELQSEAQLFSLSELPLELNSTDVARDYLERLRETVFKAPWSGSGKGLVWGRAGEFNLTLERWISGVINRQGSVIAERAYDKTADLAMEFYSDGSGVVRFAGYSFFETDNKGVYQGNRLLPDAAIEDRIGGMIPDYPLGKLRDRLERILGNCLGTVYRGYLGIDMLVFRDVCGRLGLHPCVELNLRSNMGIVSRILYDRYVASGKEGRYFVRYFRSAGQLSDFCQTLSLQYPLFISNGRVQSGYLGLTPVLAETCYHAGLIVD